MVAVGVQPIKKTSATVFTGMHKGRIDSCLKLFPCHIYPIVERAFQQLQEIADSWIVTVGVMGRLSRASGE